MVFINLDCSFVRAEGDALENRLSLSLRDCRGELIRV